MLNIGTEATGGLHLGNDMIRFQARFAGRVRDISVPVNRVASIFSRENGQGMMFELLDDDGTDIFADDGDNAASRQADSTQAEASGLALVSKSEDKQKSQIRQKKMNRRKIQFLPRAVEACA